MIIKVDDTIAAIATALGPSGIGVIRVSGVNAISIVAKIFIPGKSVKSGMQSNLSQAKSHHLYHGWIHDGENTIDEVMVAVMRAPKSYTTEDIVEIQCHGSALGLKTILGLILDNGARLAQPGEFTQRAFFYGRLDLTQVEAVNDLVHAHSKLGMRVAVNQLKGNLYRKIQEIKEEIAHVAALVEATIEFPEEDTIFTKKNECLERLNLSEKHLKSLLQSAEQGRIYRAGLGVALIGRPNVGKSSLLNALLKEKRAIVTEIPGTTRDVIEESFQTEGLAIRLIDTAGIHSTDNPVETEGIARSLKARQEADLVLLILDGSVPLQTEDLELVTMSHPEKTLIVINKKDLITKDNEYLPDEIDSFKKVFVSAKYGDGLDVLERSILNRVAEELPVREEQVLITNIRQQQTARKALNSLVSAINDIENEIGEECIAVNLKGCLRALGEIVGETTADDLLNQIFSEFCIGK